MVKNIIVVAFKVEQEQSVFYRNLEIRSDLDEAEQKRLLTSLRCAIKDMDADFISIRIVKRR